jgi:hypothetical protein
LCTHLKAAIEVEGQRISSAAGGAGTLASYVVGTSPDGGEFRDTVEFPLAYAVVPTTAPVDAMLSYASPYFSVEQTAQVTVYALLGSGVIGTTVIVTAPTSCATALTVPLGTVAIPTSATLGGVPLNSDGRALSFAPDDMLDVTWAATPGNVDYWVVQLEQILGGTAVTKLDIITLEPHATLAAKGLVAGKTYRLLISSKVGSAGAQQGHFDAFDPDSLAVGALSTSTFVPQ